MRRTEKNGTVDSVRRTYKLCCYSNTFNCGHAVVACYESTLAVHSENPFMVSNLTTGNSGRLKRSPKFRPSQKRRFWLPKTRHLLKFGSHFEKSALTALSSTGIFCRQPDFNSPMAKVSKNNGLQKSPGGCTVLVTGPIDYIREHYGMWNGSTACSCFPLF